MRKTYESELENPDTWDANKSEVRQPVKSTRVVFSVSFRRDDFDFVSKYAELCGKKTSEFIREATIEKASAKGELAQLMFVGGSQGMIWITDQTSAYTFSPYGEDYPLLQEVHPSSTM